MWVPGLWLPPVSIFTSLFDRWDYIITCSFPLYPHCEMKTFELRLSVMSSCFSKTRLQMKLKGTYKKAGSKACENQPLTQHPPPCGRKHRFFIAVGAVVMVTGLNVKAPVVTGSCRCGCAPGVGCPQVSPGLLRLRC